MRQAITTRYAGPTSSRGARILVRAEAGRMSVPYDHALSATQNHVAAAKAFAEKKVRWGGTWYGGAMPDGRGYVFVDVTTYGEAFKSIGEE